MGLEQNLKNKMKIIPINEYESPSYIIKCNCSCQMLECSVDDWDEDIRYFNFVIWSRGRDGKRFFTWKEKIRWCWNILTTGQIWGDDIIATSEDAKELAEFILNNIQDKTKK